MAGKRSRIPGLSRSVLPASTAAGEMDNFQLSISLSQKLSERRREGRRTKERGQTDVCNGQEGRGRRPNAQDSTEARARWLRIRTYASRKATRLMDSYSHPSEYTQFGL